MLAASVTNGSSTIEMFHFYNETDTNNFKTLNGRAAVSIPVGGLYRRDDRLEIGVSGEYGTPDRATNNPDKMWFVGFDLQFLGVNYALRAQIMEGKSPGRADQGVWGLDLNWSGYVEFNWLILLRSSASSSAATCATRWSRSGPIASTSPSSGGSRPASASSSTRTSVVKAEYLHNDEYGGITEFDNDVATSSLVLAF